MELFLHERVVVFIDGFELYRATRALDLHIDFKRMRSFFAGKCKLIRMNYYVLAHDHEDHDPTRKIADWLSYNGYNVLTKRAKEYINDDGKSRIKGNLNVAMAADSINLASRIDRAVIFAGDEDHVSTVQEMQRQGVIVTVVSSRQSEHRLISEELRRQADQFVDLEDLRDDFERSD